MITKSQFRRNYPIYGVSGMKNCNMYFHNKTRLTGHEAKRERERERERMRLSSVLKLAELFNPQVFNLQVFNPNGMRKRLSVESSARCRPSCVSVLILITLCKT